ncbi:MAG: archease, partial [Candidatus Hodarchaeales archaeon]
MRKNYEFIDHTADLGILVFGNDLNQLFVNAANALSEILTDTSKLENIITKEINVDGEDLEQLMINWLHEVLYYYEVY